MNKHAPALATHTQDFAAEFAAYVAGLECGQIPESAVQAAQINVYDTLSCSLAGYSADGAREVRGLVTDWGGKADSHVLWTRHRVPAPQAAWINGIMSHARDYDDTHDTAIIHAGVSAVPAALAAVDLASQPVSGEQFFTAVVAGLELNSRMAVATKIGVIDSGFIYSSLFGYFGATVAAARILGLSAEDTHNAMGIAYSQAAGGHQATRDWALTKRMQPGFAARAGLTSVAMTTVGVRGAREIFEGEDGLWRIYLRNELDRDALRDGLGMLFHSEDLAYKPYPCCRYNHSAIDAAIELHNTPGFDWRNVREVRTYTTQQCRSAIGTPIEIRQAPDTLVQAQFSICYNVACGLVNGAVGLDDYADVEALRRADVAAVTRLVTPYVDPEIERDWGRSVSPTRIEVVMADGSTLTARVDEAKGSKTKPFSKEDTRRKLNDSLKVGGFRAADLDRFDEVVGGLLASEDVGRDMRGLSADLAV